MQVGGSAPGHVFFREEAGFANHCFQGLEKLPIEVSDIAKKMIDKGPKGFFWFNVFLSAVLAKMALHFCAAVQAVFFDSLFGVGHRVNFLKIKDSGKILGSFWY
jgi:hypothetical protein